MMPSLIHINEVIIYTCIDYNIRNHLCNSLVVKNRYLPICSLLKSIASLTKLCSFQLH